MDQEPVVEIGGFEVLTRLGEGGMGRVYKARQKSIERLVALKVLTDKLAKDEDYKRRFNSEAVAAGKLNHPNIVTVIDKGVHPSPAGEMPWIAFEFVDGPSLESRIKQGRLPEREALKIVHDIALALAHANARGVIHRDVKPDNILLTADGTPKLADLGLAKFKTGEASLTQTGVVMGTPHYMAPEQALGERDIDVRADVYALGLVFYRCLTAEMPFMADSALGILTRHINQDCPDPRARVPDISEGAAQLMRGMTARSKGLRFSPEEVVEKASLLLARPGGSGAARTVAQPVSGPHAPAPGTGAGGTTQAPRVATDLARSPTTPIAPAAATRTPPLDSSLAQGRPSAAATLPPRKAAPAKEPPPAVSRTKGVTLVAAGALIGLAVFAGVAAKRKGSKTSDPPGPVTSSTPAPREPSPEEQLIAAFRKASARAAEDPAAARSRFEEAARGKPEAAAALRVARDMVEQLAIAAKALRDGERPQAAIDALDKLAKGVAKSDKLEDAARREAAAWHDAADKLRATIQFLAGGTKAAPPHGELMAESGVHDALGSSWQNGVVDGLVPAVQAFEKGEWSTAREKAQKAEQALRGPLLERLARSAQAIALLAGGVEGTKGQTPLHARAKAGSSVRPCDFLHRFDSADFTGPGQRTLRADMLKLDKNTQGLVPTLPRGREKPRPLLEIRSLFEGLFADGDAVIQVRLRIVYDEGGILVLTKPVLPKEGKVPLLGLQANKRASVLALPLVKRGAFDPEDLEDALKPLRHHGSPVSYDADFIWSPTSDGFELRIVLGGEPAPATISLKKVLEWGDATYLRGANVRITRAEWFLR